MGFDKNIQKSLEDVKLGKVLTLGRLHIKYPNEYCEKLLKELGAFSVDSMDISAYENATIIWDLNKSVSRKHHSKFNTIIDGGTLEHVYNFPVAIKNVSKMLAPYGTFISAQLLNYTGHGFYTLSPELLIKACLHNGLKPVSLKIARALGPFKLWYDIPVTLMERIEITSFWPLYMIFKAVKDLCYSKSLYPTQAPAKLCNPIKHFLWKTRLWNISK